jgi:hypothetical protein
LSSLDLESGLVCDLYPEEHGAEGGQAMTKWIETPIGYVNADHISEAFVDPAEETDTWRVRVSVPSRMEVITVAEGFSSQEQAKDFLVRSLFGLQPIG